jgi:O-antigen biosynthesis protein
VRIPRALVCAPRLPEFDRESGSRRTWDLISCLQDGGWAVSFLAERTDGDPRIARALQRRGIATYTGLEDRVVDLIAFGQFDLVLLAFWFVGERFLPLIHELSPESKVIVDSVDLHFLRASRRHFLEATRDHRRKVLDGSYCELAIRELNAFGAADAVLTVSQKEAALLEDFSGGRICAFNVPDAESFRRSPLPFAEREGMLFVGSFRHPPNAEGLEWLLQEVFPLVPPQVLDLHPLTIIGTAAEDVISLVSDVPNVRMVGWVPEVQPYFERCRISLLPLLHGAGTKRKLIQSLMTGTPAVSTSVGIEGLGLQEGVGAIVADRPDEFALAIAKLLHEESRWQKLADTGESYVREQHSHDVVARRFFEVVEVIRALPPRRFEIEEAVKVSKFGSYITADPTTVIGWPAPGSTTISWSTGDKKKGPQQGQVRVSVDGGSETIFSTQSAGSQLANWIQGGACYDFRLYGADRTLLGTVRVRGTFKHSN